MKLVNLIGDRFRETPSDCVVESHALMLRGGYMKYVANGIYSSFPPLVRITRKIEQIIREEMDAIDGQEVQFPVVLPASLWQESGRYDSVGSELLRFTDRSGSPMVLGMTHEEAAVALAKQYGAVYSRYPFLFYQIQTKFRDEARPRAGLIRVREFTMKDAYSFHTSQEDLDACYRRCHRAYERIFARAGIPEVVSVASDSGMMGGNLSHEFMLLTPAGEDSIVLCSSCGFRANKEAVEGDTCPTCGRRSLTLSRGIEVGNIFQLGTKYSKAMHMQYVDADGASQYPLMGCYGIGIGRLAASVCEARHDEYGPVWPITIAPWQVHLCCMRSDNAEVHAMADALYEKLQQAGVEVLYDDRNVSAGVMFSDADLLGIPIRLTASPRNRKEGCVEMTLRGNKADTCKIPDGEILLRVKEKIAALTAALQPGL